MFSWWVSNLSRSHRQPKLAWTSDSTLLLISRTSRPISRPSACLRIYTRSNPYLKTVSTIRRSCCNTRHQGTIRCTILVTACKAMATQNHWKCLRLIMENLALFRWSNHTSRPLIMVTWALNKPTSWICCCLKTRIIPASIWLTTNLTQRGGGRSASLLKEWQVKWRQMTQKVRKFSSLTRTKAMITSYFRWHAVIPFLPSQTWIQQWTHWKLWATIS